VFTGEEGVTKMRISDGGELGRCTDDGRQGAARSGDEGWILGTGEIQMSVEHKGEERRKARGNSTGDQLRAAGNVPAVELQRATACARGWGAEREQMRKGQDGGDSQLLYGQRREKGKQKRAGGGALAINGRRALWE
jgi:hypothetical protein